MGAVGEEGWEVGGGGGDGLGEGFEEGDGEGGAVCQDAAVFCVDGSGGGAEVRGEVVGCGVEIDAEADDDEAGGRVEDGFEEDAADLAAGEEDIVRPLDGGWWEGWGEVERVGDGEGGGVGETWPLLWWEGRAEEDGEDEIAAGRGDP